MNDAIRTQVREDFAEWSGGFPPDSEAQVFLFVDYACTIDDPDLARSILYEWLREESEADSHVDIPVIREVS
jgi:hypothetical protein